MSLTINESGDELAQTVDGITLPIDCSFAKVNGWIHGVDVHFEEVQALCLGMAAENDRLRAKLAAMESQEPVCYANPDWIKKLKPGTLLNRAAVSSEKTDSQDYSMPLYAKPAPADKPEARITEQDAREIAWSAAFYEGEKYGSVLAAAMNRWWEGPGRALLNKLNADREQVPAVDAETHTRYCALNTINDDQVRKVVRAFWRRIYPYRNNYGIELPTPMPVEFMAHMATALTWVDNKSAPAVAVPLGYVVPRLADRMSQADYGSISICRHPEDDHTMPVYAAAPSPSQQSEVADAERFCDAHCTWRDHHPDCTSHESEQSDSPALDDCCCGDTAESWRLCPAHSEPDSEG